MLLAEVDHSGQSMLHAVCRCLISHYQNAWSHGAQVIEALFLVDVDHAVVSVLIAECRLLALGVKVRLPRAGVM